jgi:hypothetical protein
VQHVVVPTAVVMPAIARVDVVEQKKKNTPQAAPLVQPQPEPQKDPKKPVNNIDALRKLFRDKRTIPGSHHEPV